MMVVSLMNQFDFALLLVNQLVADGAMHLSEVLIHPNGLKELRVLLVACEYSLTRGEGTYQEVICMIELTWNGVRWVAVDEDLCISDVQ